MTNVLASLVGQSILVTDFDGTMTRRDFFWLVVEKLLPPDLPDYWGQYRAGKITHFEALQAIFRSIRAPRHLVVEMLDEMDLDPATAAALAKMRSDGWEVVVASAGCAWYIDQLLAKADIALTVHSNPGSYVDGGGLQMSLPRESPYFSPTLGIDKAAIVRDAIASGRRTAFAGDGYPDVDAARLVEGRLRFAKGALAESLEKAGLEFVPFECWSEIADRLVKEHE